MRRPALAAALTALALSLAACGGGSEPEPAAAPAGTTGGDDVDFAAVLEAAKGQTVDWYMYGGDDRLNAYVDGYVSDRLDELGITLNQVRINDTAEAVNKVLGEVQAGRDSGGSVDLIWINGENFLTLKQADAVLCGYVDDLPSSANVDLDAPGIANDFGTPTEGCEVPWQQTTSSLVYDSTALDEDDVASVEALFAWAQENPGRFTYPAPPDFTGSMAVRTFFFDTAGGPDGFLGEFDQAAFDEAAPALWQRLQELEPALWRGGQTYAASGPEVETLFANDEIDAFLTYGTSAVPGLVEDGTFPESTRTAVFEGGNIGNYSFTAIPKNAGDKEAAMVLADLLLSAEAALAAAGPDGPGFTSAVDLSRLPAEQRAELEALPRSEVLVPAQELAEATLPEVVAGYVEALEDGWRREVLQQ